MYKHIYVYSYIHTYINKHIYVHMYLQKYNYICTLGNGPRQWTPLDPLLRPLSPKFTYIHDCIYTYMNRQIYSYIRCTYLYILFINQMYQQICTYILIYPYVYT
jgi:hypothetical protein